MMELQQVLRRYLEPSKAVTNQPARAIEEFDNGEFFLAASPAMQRMRLQAELLADLDVPLLILGESGTGKRSCGSPHSPVIVTIAAQVL